MYFNEPRYCMNCHIDDDHFLFEDEPYENRHSFTFMEDAIEHLRRCNGGGIDIRRPSAIGEEDSHGNAYCFASGCEYWNGYRWKDHKSFQSDQAMWSHLHQCHHRHQFNMEKKPSYS